MIRIMKKSLFLANCSFGTFFGVALLAFAVYGLLSSCGSDGNNGGGSNCETPKYEADVAKYTITDTGSEYGSIELTASGNYII